MECGAVQLDETRVNAAVKSPVWILELEDAVPEIVSGQRVLPGRLGKGELGVKAASRRDPAGTRDRECALEVKEALEHGSTVDTEETALQMKTGKVMVGRLVHRFTSSE
jgi:hypothetical protein